MYGYGPEAVEHIQATGSTANMEDLPVYSNLLLVDFDDKPESGHAMAEALREYDWVKFDSGGRSIHLHVRIDEMYGAWVPRVQKAWMKKHFPDADMSIYRTSGIYRLAGTYHENNPGHMKRAIETNFTGKALTIDTSIPVAPVAYLRQENADLEDMLLGLLNMEIEKGTTGRNYHAYKICKVASKLGLCEQETVELVLSWNARKCNPPLTLANIESTIISAYRKSA